MYTLYIRPECPFCEKVLNIIDEYNIEVDIKDISDDAVAQELIEHGGKKQAPYLIDHSHDTAMYESEDIISYLVTQMSGDAETEPDTDADETIDTAEGAEGEGGGE